MSRIAGLSLAISEIRSGDRIDCCPGDEERAAIADRLGLISLDRFEAHVALDRDGEQVTAMGRVKARANQACVATGLPVPADIDEAFALAFVPAPTGGSAEEEIELGEDDLDTIFHDGARIELGDALTDTLALALDPYPRHPDAEAQLKRAGILSEEEAGPFAKLASLKDQLKGEG